VAEPSGIRIVIIEVEATIHSAYQRALGTMRPAWQVSITSSGREAMKLMGESSCEVLVTDLAMRDMAGLDLLRLTKMTFPRTQRLVVSGILDGRTLIDLKLLAHAHLIKPVTIEVLVEKIEKLLKADSDQPG
jgi:DNA-binding NtrC family response regulator